MSAPRFQLADELLRRFAASLRSAQLYSPGHPIIGRNLASLMELFNRAYREQHVVQKFLPEIAEGDKRIVLIDGEVAGAINRVPGEGEIRSNLAVGDKGAATELTPRVDGYYAQICRTLVVGPASAEQRVAHALWRSSMEAGIAAVRDGITAADIAGWFTHCGYPGLAQAL